MKLRAVVIAVFELLLSIIAASSQTWTQTSAPTNAWRAIAASANGTRLTAVAGDNGGDGLIYTSANSGSTWMVTSAPTGSWHAVASSADGMKLVASGNDGVYTSWDSGTNWIPRTNLSFRSLASSTDGTRLVGANAFSLYNSTDSGASWSLSSGRGSCIASSADGVKLVSAYFAYPGHVEGGIFISTNAGVAWTATSAPLDLWTGWNSLASSADGIKLSATIGYTDWPTGPAPIYISPNGGDSWLATSSPTSHWFSIASSADGSKLVAAGDSGLFTSTNYGATWITNWSSGLTRTFVACSADGSKLAAAVEGDSIYVSQSTSTPSLRIRLGRNNVILSWTVASFEFVLQQRSDLIFPIWTEVTNTAILNFTNLENEVILSATDINRFYRLKH